MKFAIIITSYNQPEFLKEAVDSVYNQTYKDNFQLIIINDSTKLKDGYSGLPIKTNIERVFIKNKRNLGLQKSYNLGCYNVNKEVEWIIRLDGDDKLLPDTLELLSEFIDKVKDPKIAFIYSDLKILGEKNKIRIYPEWDKTLMGLQNIGHLQAVKREASEKINHWDVSLKYSADTDFIIRLIEAGYKIKHCPLTLYENRLHENQFTQQFPKIDDPNRWKNFIFNRTVQKRPELWPESYQDIVLKTTGSYFWKSEVLVIEKYCTGNGLDLGCSNRKKNPFAIGVDISREGGKIPELVWDIENELPFRSGTLDYIVGTHIVEHLIEPMACINMWMRKLKVGGYLVLVVPDKTFIPNIGSPYGDPTHLHDWNPDDFKKQVLPYMLVSHEIVKYGAIGNNWSFLCVLKRV